MATTTQVIKKVNQLLDIVERKRRHCEKLLRRSANERLPEHTRKQCWLEARYLNDTSRESLALIRKAMAAVKAADPEIARALS